MGVWINRKDRLNVVFEVEKTRFAGEFRWKLREKDRSRMTSFLFG